jgi:hypothetical protein
MKYSHDWQNRVFIEKAELDDKIVRLRSFMQCNEYSNLGEEDRGDLQYQEYAMMQYSAALARRIVKFEKS